MLPLTYNDIVELSGEALRGKHAPLHLAPLAGRGRNSGNARIPGEGDYPQFPIWRKAPHPTLSPQERDEGANNLQQSWRFDWEPPKAVLRDVWTIVGILGC